MVSAKLPQARLQHILEQIDGITAATVKAVVLHQLAAAMKERRITKRAMAVMMHTSRAQLDRLLDPGNPGVTLETLARAAKILGRELRLELL